jgi:fido (protein-threonine AMPylation protein)
MWEYTNRANHHRILSEAAALLIEELRNGKVDIVSVLKNSRQIHRRLFSSLVSSPQRCLAGGYRGDSHKLLKNYAVTIPSNRLVGCSPDKVLAAMEKFGSDAEKAIVDLDAIHENADLPEEEKLIAAIEIACRLVAEFFLIHPYANGNGHVGRFILLGILGRYEYWMASFNLHPAPFVPSYSNAIAAYQKAMRGMVGGSKDAFHKYVFARLME